MASRRNFLGPRVAGAIGAALALAVVLQQPGLIDSARDRVFDQFQRLAPRVNEAAPVKVIEIDDAALERYGQWPWPRHLFATMVDRLNEAGAAAIVLDVIFAEPDRTSPANVSRNWPDAPPLESIAGELMAGDLSPLDHDRMFAGALARAPSVLHMTSGGATSGGGCPEPLAASRVQGMDAAGLAQVAPSFRSVIAALPALREAARGEGFARAGLSGDAVVRSAPLIALACDGKQLYPSLAVEALRVAAPRLDPSLAPAAYAKRASESACRTHVTGVAGKSVSGVHVCGLRLPTAADGRIWIHYSARDAVSKRRLSAADAMGMDADALAKEVRGRIVMVGATAEGLRDVVVTPLGDERPGVHVHAEIIEQALSGKTLFRAWDLMRPVEIGTALFFCLVLLLLLPRLSATLGFAVSLVVVGGMFGGAFYAFKAERLLIDPVTPSLVVAASFLSAFVVMFQQEQIARRFIRGAFGKFLSPLIIDRLERDPSLLNLEGEEREITAFFSDIRGFTTISENLAPQQVTVLLNQYFTPMTRIVTEHKGLVDKYMGDGLAAMWNAPVDIDDHPAQACRASLAMLDALAKLNAGWRADKALVVPEIRIGIGLHTAVARVGNFGSQDRLQYSMLGDMVNLASRLEEATKEFQAPIIISADTMARVPAFAVVGLGEVTVKGRHDATAIYALVGDEQVAASAAFRSFRSNFEAGVAAMGEGRREAALDSFRAARASGAYRLGDTLDMLESKAGGA
ncbi:MAG: adenylate/guanylate cyclase domain-containing protein [Pseudomonadota bacterium]|nr:adenylate/guanylate cyclase domain-containing protein [Pseudomonadota bacterium]